MDNTRTTDCGSAADAMKGISHEQAKMVGGQCGCNAAPRSYTISDAIDHRIAECQRTVSELRDLKGSLSLGFLNSDAARVGHLRSLGLFR